MFEQYLKKSKEFVLQTTKAQRIGAFFVLLVFAGIGLYFYNPSKKLLERRNSQRRSDVVNILNTVYQYGIENPGSLEELIFEKPVAVCRTKADNCEGLVDISKIIASKKKLLSSVPVDPREKDRNSSGYQIALLANGRLSVSAPLAENGAVITLSK